jgi:hypothetical protein
MKGKPYQKNISKKYLNRSNEKGKEFLTFLNIQQKNEQISNLDLACKIYPTQMIMRKIMEK